MGIDIYATCIDNDTQTTCTYSLTVLLIQDFPVVK